MIGPLLLALVGGGLSFREQILKFDPCPTGLVVRDLTGDSRADLLVFDAGGVRIHPQDAAGFPSTPTAKLGRTAGAVLLDVATLAAGGPAEIVMLEGGRTVRAIRVTPEGRFGEPRVLLENVRAQAPLGVRRARLVQDLDGDGDGDLVLPGASEVLLFVRGKDGNYETAGAVATNVEIKLSVGDPREVSARDLKDRFESTWRVPLFDLEDVNGDGRRDLVAETEDSVAFYLAGGDGSFPREPTFRLDLEGWRKTLPQDSGGRAFNTANLIEPLSNRVEWIRRELDGDGAEDFVVRAGSRIVVFRGAAGGPDFSRPAQVLKASGNLLGIFLFDDDGDGHPDLCIARVPDISLAEALLWVVASVRVSIEVFVYREREGGTFSPRPDRRQRFTISVPSFRNLRGGKERLLAEIGRDPVVDSADLDGDGARDDLLVVAPDGAIRAFLGAAEGTGIGEEETLLGLLKEIGWGSKEEEVVVTLDTLTDLAGRGRGVLSKAIAGKEPAWSCPPPEGFGGEKEPTPSLWVLDLDGDGRDDAIVGWSTPSQGKDRPFVATCLFSSGAPPSGR